MGLAGILGFGSVKHVTAQEATAAAEGIDDYVWAPPAWEPEPKQFEVLERSDETVRVRTIDGEFDVPANPQRILCINSDYHTLIPLGIEEGYAAVYKDPATELPIPSGADTELINRVLADVPGIPTSWQPDLEEIISYEPDIIIGGGGYQSDEEYAILAQSAPFIRTFGSAFESPRQFLRDFGALFGREERAEEVIAEHETYFERARQTLAPLVEGKKAALLRPGEGSNHAYASYYLIEGSSDLHEQSDFPVTFAAPLFRELQLTPSSYFEQLGEADDRSSRFLAISSEQMGNVDADFVFFGLTGYDGMSDEQREAALDTFINDPVVQTTVAAKNSQIYAYGSDYDVSLASVKERVQRIVEAITGQPFE